MRKIFPYLTYAGAAPFIFCALCLNAQIHHLPWFGPVKTILAVYGLMIASFLAGAHWGQHLHKQGFWHHFLAVISNMIAVLLWLGFLILPFKILMMMFIVVLLSLLAIDYRLSQVGLITQHYLQTRIIVSAIVCVSLVISTIVS